MDASRTLLSPAKEGAVFCERVVDLDETRSGEQLDDHAGGDDGGDAELHEGAAVGGEDDSHPVERVWAKVSGDTSRVRD